MAAMNDSAEVRFEFFSLFVTFNPSVATADPVGQASPSGAAERERDGALQKRGMERSSQVLPSLANVLQRSDERST